MVIYHHANIQSDLYNHHTQKTYSFMTVMSNDILFAIFYFHGFVVIS